MSIVAMGPTQPLSGYVGNLHHTESGRGVGLTTQLDLVLRLMKSGNIPPLALYTFMVYLGTTLPASMDGVEHCFTHI
jgi:hypothetical protein